MYSRKCTDLYTNEKNSINKTIQSLNNNNNTKILKKNINKL